MIMQSGTFKAHVTDVGLGYTSTGGEQIVLQFTIDEGPCQGEQILWHGSFSEKAEKFTIKTLQTCGWTGIDISTLNEEDMPETVSLVIAEDEFNGQTKFKIKWINAMGGLAIKSQMTQAQKTAFAQKLKGKLMAVQANLPKPKPKKAVEELFNPDEF
jgi:hypothetical protein